MKKSALMAILVLVPMAVAAWEPEAMTRLKETGDCPGCDLSDANLRWANVYEAELAGAPNLVGAALSDADLSGADLYGANLEGADLRRSNLSGAKLSWATLKGADLTGADLTDATVDGVSFCNTTMPDGRIDDTNC